MRLLHVTPVYVPSIGGIEEVVSNLAQLGRQAGVEADVVHVARGLAHSQRRMGDVSVTTLPLVGHRMLGWAPGLGQLASGYNLLHVHDPQVGALTLNICGSFSGIPAVLSTHGGFFHTSTARSAKWLHARITAPLLLKRYRKVLASSRTDFAAFGQYSRDTVLVENGVNTTRFGGMQAGGTRDPRRWIYWGRLSSNKRLDSLIRLVATLAQQDMRVDLAICGSDFDGTHASLQRLVADLHMEKQIAFRIGLDDAALRAEIATRAVFVLPSEYEGFGLSLVEAMGAGLIPVCRDAAPMNALAGSAAVLLRFDGGPDDIARIHQLLVATAAGIESRRAAAALQAAAFDWRARFPAFLQQYQACLDGPGELAYRGTDRR